MKDSKVLPDYESPPVVEVVCGVLFKPLEKLLAPHFGLLWERFKPEYSRCQEVAPLEPIIESASGVQPPLIEFTIVPPLPRIWFLHTDESGLIQLQRDRFLYNWRKTKAGHEYPRYPAVVSRFRDHMAQFQSFLKETDLGAIAPLQYELTYVNHIPKGEGWTTADNVGSVLPDFAWRNHPRFLTVIEGFQWKTAFALPEQSGRLHATIQHAIRRQDNRELLILDLTARGIGADKSLDGMWRWLDMAREWIVRGFADLTADEVQKKTWRRRQ